MGTSVYTQGGSVALYVCLFSLQTALAIGITGSIRVGQQLGAGRGLEAKRVFHFVLVITCKQIYVW